MEIYDEFLLEKYQEKGYIFLETENTDTGEDGIIIFDPSGDMIFQQSPLSKDWMGDFISEVFWKDE